MELSSNEAKAIMPSMLATVKMWLWVTLTQEWERRNHWHKHHIPPGKKKEKAILAVVNSRLLPEKKQDFDLLQFLLVLLGPRSAGRVKTLEKGVNIRKFVYISFHCATTGNELNNWSIWTVNVNIIVTRLLITLWLDSLDLD